MRGWGEGGVGQLVTSRVFPAEICLLTNAKRVASVRAETYCNLFSLSVEHFTAVLEHYPVMRRTMESVAAERLNKIGENPSVVSSRGDVDDDICAMQRLIDETTSVASSGSDASDAPPPPRVRSNNHLLAAKMALRKCLSDGDFSKMRRHNESAV